MGSGNFLLGNNLSLEEFKQHVRPELARTYDIPDVLGIPYSVTDQNTKAVLVSIVGEGDLERGVNDILAATGEHFYDMQEQFRKGELEERPFWYNTISEWTKNGQGDKKVFEGHFKTLGTYQGDATASQLFVGFAQDYMLEGVSSKLSDLKNSIQRFKETQIKNL